jgi:hypothetical protein
MKKFYHRLAIALGMTVRELLQRMDSRELVDWIAYWQLEPWGEERADLRAGIVASAATNVWVKKGKRTKPQDFVPRYGPEPGTPTQPQSEMVRIFKQAASAFNKRQRD